MSTVAIHHAHKHGMYAIIARDTDGHQWILNRTFKRDDPLTVTTLHRIRSIMVIDTKHWHRKRKGEW